MKAIIQIFVITLCLAMLGQSYLQACQTEKSVMRMQQIF